MRTRTTTLIIGAGHSGLAMSRRLAERSIDHVVLERGEPAASWSQRWGSLRLLTPSWHLGLPGGSAPAGDPDGFLGTREVAEYLRGYAAEIAAPVQTRTTVTRLARDDEGFSVETDQGHWRARSVVLAAGGNALPVIPALAEGLDAGIAQRTALDYRSPEQFPAGGVLVVGASATGVQLAEELARAGRRVVLSAGEHVRMPRRYRGRDIFWWMEQAGVLDERYDQVDDLIRARHVPSPQLIGSPDGRAVGLGPLQELGVEIVGRLGRLAGTVAQFSGGLANTARLADLKQERLLDRFDAWAEQAGLDGLAASERPAPTVVADSPRLELDLAREGFGTVLWATGFAPDLSWLEVPEAIGYKGRLRHDGGVVTTVPGLYSLGTSLLRTRRSTYIAGAAQDSAALAEHLIGVLAAR